MTMHRIPIAHFTDGTELALFLHEIAGQQGDGPTLGVSAAIHGNEPTGTLVVREIAKRFASGNFRGRLQDQRRRADHRAHVAGRRQAIDNDPDFGKFGIQAVHFPVAGDERGHGAASLRYAVALLCGCSGAQ